METTMKKKTMNSLWMWVLGICMLLAGVQSAWAQKCAGTVYVKAPAGWTSVYVSGQNGKPVEATYSEVSGLFKADLSLVGADAAAGFSVGDKPGPDQSTNDTLHYIDTTSTGYAIKWDLYDGNKLQNSHPFVCPGKGERTFVTENGQSSKPINAKYLYMMVPPDLVDWMSSATMISMDGGQTGKMMTAAPDKCGWYYYEWLDEAVTNNVVFYREDAEIDPTTGLREDMLGLNGNWEENDNATPIELKTYFEDADTLYFVPDENQHLGGDDDIGWYTTFPEGVEGVCEYTLAALIYDTDASLHGAFTCAPTWTKEFEGNPGLANKNGCPNPSAPFQVAGSGADVPCIGVTQGMVEKVLDHTKGSATYKKPTLTTKGQSCFGSTPIQAFSAMFNSTTGVNETYCVDLPFTKSSDNKWEFDSDNHYNVVDRGTKLDTVRGGFYPAEITPPVDRFLSEKLPAAENKRKAEGPVFMSAGLRALHPSEGVPYADLLCNGPGWEGGINCEGWYAGGSEFNSAKFPGFSTGTALTGMSFEGDGWAWSVLGPGWCNEDESVKPNGCYPKGWTFYIDGSEKVSTAMENGLPKGSSRWLSGEAEPQYDAQVYTDGRGRNQHFCFESHAKFTHKKGLRFSFRGDDDIWVFIDNMLAVDLGGTHLAAPGYVDLDNFTGASGTLQYGEEYDLDIFFCDRRTTMSNVRIKTNMYIRQKSDIEVNRDAAVSNAKGYEVCFTKSGDGSCSAAMAGGGDEPQRYCGNEILNNGIDISYWLVQGKSIGDSVNRGSQHITYDNGAGAKLHNCIIDLTNFTKPVIGDAEKVCGLGMGRYTLFVKIEGKSRQVATFRPKGDVDVVYRNGIALDTLDKPIPNGTYKLIDMAMAGEFVPVYVSNVREPDNPSDPLNILPQDASNVGYSLAPDEGLQLCFVPTRDEDGNVNGCSEWLGAANGNRTIGASGIDTVYAYVSPNDLTVGEKVFQVGVKGKANKMSITFFLPVVRFIKGIPEGDDLPVAVTGDSLQADGTYEERWVGSVYDLYLAIFRPDGQGGIMLCPECHLDIQTGETSPQITFKETSFENGYATISIIATKEYRYDPDTISFPPAQIEVTNALGTVTALYRPIYFREPPVPSPRLADVFDVRGHVPEVEYKMPAPYFSMNYEYLDGIGDSVAIYYHRAIHQDSLPSKICIAWDTASALKYYPSKGTYTNENGKVISINGESAPPDTFSTISKDTLILCNALVNVTAQNIDCSNAAANGSYCTNVIKIGGLTLSEKVKTVGSGKVISYAAFKDKGKLIKQGFPGDLIDRIAPVPVRAEVRGIMTGDDHNFDSLVVVMSEPVKWMPAANKKSALDFYLNSAADLSEESRYVPAGTLVNGVQDGLVGTSSNGEGRIKYQYSVSGISPHVGDFVRLGGDLSAVFWSDDADISHPYDSLRNTADDAIYNWNSPTAYNEVKRLPTPWVLVSGEPELKIVEQNFANTGNAPAGENVPVFSVNGYSTNMSKDEVIAAEGGRTGLLAYADMYSLINDKRAKGFEDKDLNPQNIYFAYEIQFYTNLGNYVASSSGKIYCDDSKNKVKYFSENNPSGLCTETGVGSNFFIGWNMRSDKGRVVGTGAYIVKYKTYIMVDKAGKDAKHEKTSVWGVKRSPIPNLDYLKKAKK